MVEERTPQAPTSSKDKIVVAKRRYVSPRLEEYGRLSDLTGSGTTDSPDLGGGSQRTF